MRKFIRPPLIGSERHIIASIWECLDFKGIHLQRGHHYARYIKDCYPEWDYELEVAQSHLDQLQREIKQVPKDRYREVAG